MKKTREETEAEFADKINCNFPYDDMEECYRLIEEAKSISLNSVFIVIEELARTPFSDIEKIGELRLKHLLQKTLENFTHPILDSIVRTANLMIEHKEQSVDEAVQLMKDIEKYPGLWAALNIAYFSCDDIDGQADRKFDEIRNKWNYDV
ncbi:hypothetical protein [Prolixibacter denitrificans]|uniref:Uncharacterized protein n=1 Tax=Prolixibacter denitrificans TaxID=1541063 RepID=A0A2P8CBI1_9BACT|nr:hypothetical protein [Prolixibacter denitrificans]PSK82321.1 hypothetical protein CLV93_10665 [Prolixibacter denitrificans]GET22933.1 hypothetical protein JCM18694_31790 [Prolixibacter denitrificans]